MEQIEIVRETVRKFFCSDDGLENILSPSEEDLLNLENAIQHFRPMYNKDPDDPVVAFQYASTLLLHSRHSYLTEGVRIMEFLILSSWQDHCGGAGAGFEARATGSPGACVLSESSGKKEPKPSTVDAERGTTGNAHLKLCTNRTPLDLSPHYFHLVVGWIKLQDYSKALACVNRMLQLYPDHPEGIALKRQIDMASKRTLAATGLAAACITAVLTVAVFCKGRGR
ncbi:hypothetical protein ERJ75_000044700 [Trypanosoma vivax]|uniref:Mitochondrial fission 1 protein n=1 Tax=Trypanosoma vivax (strain Y486) TaxID=1055687 RepID=G0U7E1_TRYVY|nr:hypothetical protein TRVL_06340 [Trypanosoma vivax]KAH8620749.1 hypothetical protein ERJ75_000044700 [Trypanosoma vivax]CCC51799.1 conserved hypothetical protein [Trypanosoma vivax Y486]